MERNMAFSKSIKTSSSRGHIIDSRFCGHKHIFDSDLKIMQFLADCSFSSSCGFCFQVENQAFSRTKTER